jgi:hypothetical protein
VIERLDWQTFVSRFYPGSDLGGNGSHARVVAFAGGRWRHIGPTRKEETCRSTT